ncbi:MAG: EF-P lysine aminoacylase GenX [Proteobacteria bacterium]|nr:EF-P lysine aminoacylase GenX [Pseudomonadota bacterium]
MNRSLAEQFKLRAVLRRTIRNFFDSNEFTEIETPCLVRTPGTEVYLNYFETSWESLRGEHEWLYLRSSPELHMKQALASGCRKIYQIGPCFRNKGELGPWHHPEFTMLEWYHCGTTYEAFMNETTDLLREASRAIAGLGFQSMAIPNHVPTFTVADAFKKFAGMVLVDQDPDLASHAKMAGVVSIRGDEDFDTAFFKVLLEKIEPALAQFPVAILCDYPPSQAALAAISGGVAKRFEFFLNGIELSNAFLELSGRSENEVRIRESSEKRKSAGLPPVPLDVDFLEAMQTGLPSCAGNALGFERLLALLLGDSGISGVLPFRQSLTWRKHLP